MSNYSPALPLTLNPRDGAFENLQDLISVTTQNLKMILLTVPGERVMDPTFGVGIRNYLFEQSDITIHSRIRSAISQQVKKYLPFVTIEEVLFINEANDSMIQSNKLSITIRFFIRPLGANEQLTINV